jgi:hypothetical protein
MANIPGSPIHVTLMMEGITFLRDVFLQEPHGVTFQKVPFFKKIVFFSPKN